MIKKLQLLTILVLCMAASLSAQTVNFIEQVTSSDNGNSDKYGVAMAMDGVYMVVGAAEEDHAVGGGSAKGNAGSAYILKFDGSNWNEVTKIVASDRTNNDQFGTSVAISGDYVVVGTPFERHNEVGASSLTGAGSAYIFQNDGADNFTQVQKIVASDRSSGGGFGVSITMSGDYIAVGSNADAVYIFENNAGTWSETQILTSSDLAAGDGFGKAVSLHGNSLLVGADQEDEDETGTNYAANAGSAYIFENNAGTWSQAQKIVASDRTGGESFGVSVDIHGGQLIVGATGEDLDASGANSINGAGAAYVFEMVGPTWMESAKLDAVDRGSGESFGNAVGIENGVAVVGAKFDDAFIYGAAYIFEKNGAAWTDGVKVTPAAPDFFTEFGNDVAIAGDLITSAWAEKGGGSFLAYEVEKQSCTGTTATIDTVACGSVTINSETYSTGGTFMQLLTNAGGCDSVLTINVTISTPVSVDLVEEACESFMLNGQTYTSSGDYVQTLTASNGCDSIINLDLTINNPVSVDLVEEACESFMLNGQTYTSSGDYVQTLTAANGCDSIINLDLTINEPVSVDLVEQTCGSYMLNGQTYTSSGNYVQTLTATNGCDSIINLDLTISSSVSVDLVEEACESFMLNGQTYTSTGMYTQTLTSSAGCDSIVNLDLTITTSVTINLVEEACESFTLNNQTYTSSGNYLQFLVSQTGCDSIINLDLTINESKTVIVLQEACDSYTYNGQMYTESGNYQHVFTGANGCDSIVDLHLTIATIDDEVLLSGFTLNATQADASYQWIDCDDGNKSVPGQNAQSFTPSSTGNYAAIITKGSCVSVSPCVYVDIITSVDDLKGSLLSLYPNPTEDQATLELGEVGEFLVNVYAANGQMISSATVQGETAVNVGTVPGIYTVEVINLATQEKEVIRLLKQ